MNNFDPNNDDRAAWAENAVNVFAEETYCGRTFTATVKEQPDTGDDAYTMCQDLISDILHLARKHGWEADRMIRNAVGAFEEEVAEEDEPAECGQCEGTGRTQSTSNLKDEECPVCDGSGELKS